MENIKKDLFALSRAASAGYITAARDKAFEILNEYTDSCERCDNLSVIGKIKGEGDYTLMLDAHIDEIAFVVTDIHENGFLTIAKAGGFDLRALPAQAVTVHGKEKVPAVFCSTPPHLSSGEISYDDIGALKIDTLLGSCAKEIISLGDLVTFDCAPECLLGNRVTGKAFDDRAGVCVLLELARRLKGKKLPINVVFLLSDAEELGLRGAATASYTVSPDEAIAIDVSFGDAPDVAADDCGVLGNGAMIGHSPVLDKNISARLTKIAEGNKIPHKSEIMGGKTGTNGDVIGISRGGVKTGLVSIPIRNMHTAAEVLDLDDIVSVCDILEQYILAGGNKNA